MIKIILLLISIFFSLNLEPDKDNARTLNEYDIRCYIGTETYKIENTYNRKYLVLIKASSISAYSLYGGDKILSYDNNIKNDYFYPIQGNKTLYFVIQTYSSLCFSFMFSDYNYIYLKNDEVFKHPIVNYETRIQTKIENISDKHFIFCIDGIWTPYDISLNGKNYRKKSREEIQSVISMIPKENEMEIELDMGNIQRVISLKYISNSYVNVTEDINKCISYDDIKTYFINKVNKYFMISFTDDSQYEFYENNLPINFEVNSIYSLDSRNFFFLPKLDACFQLSFLNKSYIEINNGYSLKIINSNRYRFTINNDGNSLDTTLLLYINSTSNNFIKLKKK